jgi:ATP-dependent Clp protease ATP-binding subunit ClpX
VNTDDILFICGGAFVGLEDIVGQRTGKKVVGFGQHTKGKTKKKKAANIMELVEPEDLIKYGLIPEFVGRMPVLANLHELDENALVRILTEPRSSLVKQYQKLLSLDNVHLRFTDGALRAVARKAIRRKAGARGLRAILEERMLEVMYEIPSEKGITECLVGEEVIEKNEKPVLIYEKQSA